MQILLLLLNLILSAFLTGLIWFVQIVHYPIFARVPASHFIAFQSTHMQTTGYIVAAPMLLELAGSFALLWYPFPGIQQTANYAAFACVLLIWLVTFFVSVPIHNQLVSMGLRQELISRLVATNWLRTICWTLRTMLLGYILLKQVS
jgi:hypothetical protein